MSLRTLKLKLFFTYLLIAIIPMFIFGQIIASYTDRHITTERTRELRSFATQIALDSINQNYIMYAEGREDFESSLDTISANLRARITITDAMAFVIYDSSIDVEGQMESTPDILSALRGETQEFVSEDSGDSFIHIVMPIIEGSEIIGSIRIIHHLVDTYRISDALTTLSFTLSLVLGFVVAIIVLLNSQWLLRPLKQIMSAVKNISEGKLQQRINLSGRDEFAALGAAFNDMTERLVAIESARSEFVSNVSHELKTPISSIKILCDSLLTEEGTDVETYRDFFQDITVEVDRMTSIINELLTLVRLDAVELPLNISSVDLGKLISTIVKRLKPLADQKDIEITINEERPITIEADEMKITLAISNLIENAIKYTNNQGEVNITIDADNKNAFITVADNGIGIAEEEQQKVFDRFYRVDKGRDSTTGGTGLGLSITHKTILLHKGSIKLTSKEEEGSTFIARFPIKRGE